MNEVSGSRILWYHERNPHEFIASNFLENQPKINTSRLLNWNSCYLVKLRSVFPPSPTCICCLLKCSLQLCFFFWSSVFSVFLRTWISTQTLDGRRQWHPLRHCEAGVKVPSGLKEIGSGSERCAPHLKVVNIKYIILRAIKLVKRKAAHRTFYFVALFSNIGIILVWKSLPLWNFAQNVGMFWGHVSLRSFRISSWNHF